MSPRFKNAFLHVSVQEQILFARHLAIMTKAGMSLIDSLQMLKRQAKSRGMRMILDGVTKDVSNGQFLSVALEPYIKVFGELFVNIVRIGETSGTLPENLTYLAQELTKKRQLATKIKGALFYPLIILVGTVGIITLLVTYVLPKILPVFQSLNVTLPLPTRILIAVSSFAQQYILYIFIAVIIVIVAFLLLLRIKGFQYVVHRFLLFLPVAGTLAQQINIANFTRTLGILLKSGAHIVEAVGTSAMTLGNLVFREALGNAAEKIKKGEELSAHLSEFPKLFPGMLYEMIAVGENTGNLSETLLYLGDYYEEEIDNATKNLSTVLEPLLLIIMGVIVGFVAIAIITPIYSITQGVR
ncbi:MAG: type II secretion system F family protein [Candidatus Harrisonbacteria bacterium]|nr:type II secretion system F family protein [Candidatus Harrisonbacteria bacterium]MBI3114655.1 type II secretion system F family protein [Candidatus Harrisonbacteria bacterium]